MKGFPSELLFILLFGAAMLFNFLIQRAARKTQAEAPPSVPEPDEIPEAVWRGESAVLLQPPATVASPQRRAAPPVAAPIRARRRFSRQSLLGSRRQVQDAFVVAAILGRCRGDEPLDIR